MFRKGRLAIIFAMAFVLTFTNAIAYGAPMKYAGIQYSAWFQPQFEWHKSWDPNSWIWDFEYASDAEKYSLTGTAFGRTNVAHGSLAGWHGSCWMDSFTGGEAATGTFRTQNITLSTNIFKFRAAGYDGASGTANRNYYYLKRASDNAILFTAKPPQSDTFAWIQWDVSAYNGQSVYFEAVDNNSDSSYAWLAADEITHDPYPTPQPVEGFYTSDDPSVAADHARTLKDMGIDFIVLDNTNNMNWGPAHPQASYQSDWIYNNSKTIIDAFATVSGAPKAVFLSTVTTWDSDTTDVQRLITENLDSGTPYMYYPWIPSNTGDLWLDKISQMYNDEAKYPTKYFYYDGKPLLFLFVSTSATVYDKNNVDRTPNGKMPDTWDPVIPNTGGKTLRQLFTIRWMSSLVSGSGNAKLVPSTGDTTQAYNGHWSWIEKTPQSWASFASPSGVVPESVLSSPSVQYSSEPRNNGLTYSNQYNRVFQVDPIFNLIHSWNEFSPGDEPSPEYSQTIEPTTNYYGDTYATLTKNYISFFKSKRYDIGLYDTYSGDRTFYTKNRYNDYGGYTFDFNFETHSGFDIGTSNVEAVAGDFNGDGHEDIALRNVDTGLVTIRYSPFFAQTSVAGQLAETSVSLEAGSRYKMFSGDFNGDGKADIGFYDSTGAGFIIRYGNGNGAMGTAYTWPWALSGSYQFSSGDMNGDGKSDIVFRDPSTGTITIGLAQADGLQSKPASIYTYNWNAPGSQYQLITGDFKKDGYFEIGLRDSSIGRFYVLENLKTSTGGTWNFGNQKQFDWASGSQYLPLTGDFR